MGCPDQPRRPENRVAGFGRGRHPSCRRTGRRHEEGARGHGGDWPHHPIMAVGLRPRSDRPRARQGGGRRQPRLRRGFDEERDEGLDPARGRSRRARGFEHEAPARGARQLQGSRQARSQRGLGRSRDGRAQARGPGRRRSGSLGGGRRAAHSLWPSRERRRHRRSCRAGGPQGRASGDRSST